MNNLYFKRLKQKLVEFLLMWWLLTMPLLFITSIISRYVFKISDITKTIAFHVVLIPVYGLTIFLVGAIAIALIFTALKLINEVTAIVLVKTKNITNISESDLFFNTQTYEDSRKEKFKAYKSILCDDN